MAEREINDKQGASETEFNDLDLLDLIQNEFDTLIFDEKNQTPYSSAEQNFADQLDSEFARIDTFIAKTPPSADMVNHEHNSATEESYNDLGNELPHNKQLGIKDKLLGILPSQQNFSDRSKLRGSEPQEIKAGTTLSSKLEEKSEGNTCLADEQSISAENAAHDGTEQVTKESTAPIPTESLLSAGHKIAAAEPETTAAALMESTDQRASSRYKGISLAIAYILLAAAVASTYWVLNMPTSQQKQVTFKIPTQAKISTEQQVALDNATTKSISSVNSTTQPELEPHTTQAQASTEQQVALDNTTTKSTSSVNSTTQPELESHTTQAKASTEQKQTFPDNKAKNKTHANSKLSNNGRWIVNLASFNSEIDAQAFLARLGKTSGVRAEVRPSQIKTNIWYRVRMTGFTSKLEAEKQRTVWMKKLKVSGAWVSKRN